MFEHYVTKDPRNGSGFNNQGSSKGGSMIRAEQMVWSGGPETWLAWVCFELQLWPLASVVLGIPKLITYLIIHLWSDWLVCLLPVEILNTQLCPFSILVSVFVYFRLINPIGHWWIKTFILFYLPYRVCSFKCFSYFYGRCQEKIFIQHQEYPRMVLWLGYSGITLTW